MGHYCDSYNQDLPMILAVFKNVLILMSLAFFAYHLDAFSQVSTRPHKESINPLMFLTQNDNSLIHVNYINSGRSLLYSKELSTMPILPGSIHWSAQGQTRLLTYAHALPDGKVDLKVATINPSPVFTLKSQSIPTQLQDEFQFKHWIAKTSSQLYATTGDALYFVTIGTRSQTKATLVHKPSGVLNTVVDVLDFDSAYKNLIFAYNTKPGASKTYYALNLDTQKISVLKASSSCKGKIIHFNNRLIAMGENQFLAYCQATATSSPAFLFFDFTKLTSTRYETKEELNENSNITIDSFGYFILVKNVKDRIMYCNGNIKDRLSVRCLNTSSLNNGFIFSAGNLAQFFMISSNNIFSIDFPTGISRRTSILFDSPLDGKVLDPISL